MHGETNTPYLTPDGLVVALTAGMTGDGTVFWQEMHKKYEGRTWRYTTPTPERARLGSKARLPALVAAGLAWLTFAEARQAIDAKYTRETD